MISIIVIRLNPLRLSQKESKMKKNITEYILIKAGIHAWQYFQDAGECLFCSVDNADNDNDNDHEDFCPFYRVDSESLWDNEL